MASKSTNKKNGTTVAALVLDAYQQYCSLGYPNDPNIYEVRVSGETYQLLIQYVQNLFYPKEGARWPFKILNDTRVPEGEILFGPEQVTILWRDRNGM